MINYFWIGYSVFFKLPKWIGGTVLRWMVQSTFKWNKVNAIPHLHLLSPKDTDLFEQLNYPSLDYPTKFAKSPSTKDPAITDHAIPDGSEIHAFISKSGTSRFGHIALNKLPLMLFSHGIMGIRTSYSGIISELVSHGWVVCAVEHADGSAGYTRTVDMDTNDSRLLEGATPLKSVPFQFMEMNEEMYPKWNQRLSYRTAEMDIVFSYMHHLSKGTTEDFFKICPDEPSDDLANLQTYISKNPEKAKYFSLYPQNQRSMFKDRLDFDKFVLSGHSMGSATCFECCLESSGEKVGISSKFRSAIQGILAMDPWMYPISRPYHFTEYTPFKPILVINSEKFFWRENSDALESFLEKSQKIMKDYLKMKTKKKK